MGRVQAVFTAVYGP